MQHLKCGTWGKAILEKDVRMSRIYITICNHLYSGKEFEEGGKAVLVIFTVSTGPHSMYMRIVAHR